MKDEYVLHQNSPNEELKHYFERIFELEQTGEKFPVDLNEVWLIVYSRRDNAVRELKEKFKQGIDYQVFRQKAENSKGGRPTQKIRLSVACLEYFIARKVRPVFEVYRRATHEFRRMTSATSISPNTSASQILDLIDLKYQAIRQQQVQIDDLGTRVLAMENRTKTHPECFTVMGYASFIGKRLTLKQSAAIGRKATAYCKKNDIELDEIWDIRHGKVNVYPKEVLERIFEALL